LRAKFVGMIETFFWFVRLHEGDVDGRPIIAVFEANSFVVDK